MKRRAGLILITGLMASGFLLGCQPTTSDPATASAASAAYPSQAQLALYASTNVWAAVAQAVAGEHIAIHAGVTSPNQDPHDYQPSVQDKREVTNAQWVLVNGGGYDDWLSQLAASVGTPQSAPKQLDAVAISTLKTTANEATFNEHVFYSLPTVKKLATVLASDFGQQDPTHQADYQQHAQQLITDLNELEQQAQTIGHQHAGRQLTAFATEPVVGYLLQAMAIKDVTPAQYAAQSETQAGVSAKVLADSKALLASGGVDLLVVNAQTEDAASQQLVAIAQAHHIPVVAVNETFTDGVTTYPQFIKKTLDAFAGAIRQLPAG